MPISKETQAKQQAVIASIHEEKGRPTVRVPPTAFVRELQAAAGKPKGQAGKPATSS